LTRYLNELTARVAKAALRGGEKSALGIVATIVGAITLARAVDDDELAKSVLSSSLALVMTQDGDGSGAQ